MRWIRKRTEVAALGLGLCVLACEQGVEPPIGKSRDVKPQRGGTLRTAFYTNVRTLDAAVAFDTASAALENLLYDRLVYYDEQGRLVPQLASSIDVSEDGKRYVFTLRRGVRFHDGTTLHASDVKRSLERALHSKTPCPVPSFYEHISGYAEFHQGKTQHLSGVKVEGELVVSIALSEPDATFLHVMALPTAAPVCKSAGSTYDRNFSLQACGTGPFELAHWEPGQRIRLKRHEGYWKKGLPYLDEVVWYLGMQSYTQRFKFEQGDIDYIREFNLADSMLYRTSPAWQGMGQWETSMTTGGVFMNTEMPPFDDRHFRRAVAFALDHSQVAAVRHGHVTAHPRVVPEAILETVPGMRLQHHDLERALEEMRLAGYPYDPETGDGGYPKEIPYLALFESFGQQAGEIYQQQLAKIGIDIRLELVGWPTFLAKTSRRNMARIGTAGWHADFPDASDFFEPILSSAAIQEEESQNAAFFSNRELDRLLVKARRETDPRARDRMYRRAEEIVASEAPWAVGYSYRYFELWHPYVHGYRPHPVISQDVRRMWFDHAERRATAQRERWLPSPWRRAVRRMVGSSALAAQLGAVR